MEEHIFHTDCLDNKRRISHSVCPAGQKIIKKSSLLQMTNTCLRNALKIMHLVEYICKRRMHLSRIQVICVQKYTQNLQQYFSRCLFQERLKSHHPCPRSLTYKLRGNNQCHKGRVRYNTFSIGERWVPSVNNLWNNIFSFMHPPILHCNLSQAQKQLLSLNFRVMSKTNNLLNPAECFICI